MTTGGPDVSNSSSKGLGVKTSGFLERGDLEVGQGARAEIGGDRYIGRIPPPRHQDASDPRLVVPGVECVPLTRKIHLEPSAEVHRRRIGRNTDVAEIAGAVACRNIHATAKRDGKVREIPADAQTLVVSVPCRSRGAGVLVSEDKPLVNVITDRLNTRPSWLRRGEQRPSQIRQAIGIAIAA